MADHLLRRGLPYIHHRQPLEVTRLDLRVGQVPRCCRMLDFRLGHRDRPFCFADEARDRRAPRRVAAVVPAAARPTRAGPSAPMASPPGIAVATVPPEASTSRGASPFRCLSQRARPRSPATPTIGGARSAGNFLVFIDALRLVD